MGLRFRGSRRQAVGLVLLCLMAAAPPKRGGQLTSPRDRPAPEDGAFSLTTPVACREIKGYDDFVPLPGAALTADEKLLVYFEPRHYKTVRAGDSFEAHFSQDVVLRRRGQKAVLWSKKDILDYTARAAQPPTQIFLRNTIALKGHKPGEYDLDIVVRDEVGKGSPAHQTLPFTVQAPDPKGQEGGPEKPPGRD